MDANAPSVRLEMTVSQNTVKRLLELQVKTEAFSGAEVVREALKLYSWVIGCEEKGYRVYMREEDGYLVGILVNPHD